MNKIILYILKPLSFLPALLMMYIIFRFSAQTGEVSGNLSYEVSYRIVKVGDMILDTGLTEQQLSRCAHRIEHPVRKLAHMTEYFFLAIAVSFPLYVYGVRGFLLMLAAGFICVAFAAGDEFHQSFVDGRGPSKRDVMIDSIGVFFGILVVRITCWTFLAPLRIAQRSMERAQRRERAQQRLAKKRAQQYSAMEQEQLLSTIERKQPRSAMERKQQRPMIGRKQQSIEERPRRRSAR